MDKLTNDVGAASEPQVRSSDLLYRQVVTWPDGRRVYGVTFDSEETANFNARILNGIDFFDGGKMSIEPGQWKWEAV